MKKPFLIATVLMAIFSLQLLHAQRLNKEEKQLIATVSANNAAAISF
jgi:hypothetical protein